MKKSLLGYPQVLAKKSPREVGKAGDEILVPAYVVWPVYVALIVGWFGWNYLRRLLPQKRQLEALVQSYQ